MDRFSRRELMSDSQVGVTVDKMCKMILITRFIIQVRMLREEPSPIVTMSSTIR